MDPGLENAKILMAQAKRPIAILRERSLRLFDMKTFAFFKFITFIIAEMREGQGKESVDKLKSICHLIILLRRIRLRRKKTRSRLI